MLLARRRGNDTFDADFYSMDEWLEQYEEAMDELKAQPRVSAPVPAKPATSGPASAPVRATQLAEPAASAAQIAARRAALDVLGAQLAVGPKPSDELGRWFVAKLSARLASAGITTLASLAAYINTFGYRWHARIPGLGATSAHALIDWVDFVAANATDERSRELLTIGQAARLPAQQLANTRREHVAQLDQADVRTFAIVPLERLAVPPRLDGRIARFRVADDNTLGASNDIQAIEAYLRRHARSPRTWASYASAIERYYLWLLLERGKALGDAIEEDLHLFREFLANPTSRWIQRVGGAVRRDDSAWRPLRGPLAPASQRHVFAAVGALYRALIEARYVSANPVPAVVKALKLPPARMDRLRSLSPAQWNWITHVLRAQAPSPSRTRLELILELAATTGMRRLELSTARHGDLRQALIDGQAVTLLDLVGKGGKPRTVQIEPHVLELVHRHARDQDAMIEHWGSATRRDQAPVLSLQADPQDKSKAAQMRPLIGTLRPPVGMTREELHGDSGRDRRPIDHPALPAPRAAAPGPEDRRAADRYGALEPSALYQSLKRLFARAAQRARTDPACPLSTTECDGLQELSTHWLRHFFANAIGDAGVPVEVIQQLLGHADIRTSAIYRRSDELLMVRALRQARGAAAGR